MEGQTNGREKDLGEEIANCKPMLFSTLRSQGLSHHDAEDITQEAMTKAIEAQENFDGKSSVSTWLYRIAMNSKIDMFRKRGRKPEVAIGLDHERMLTEEEIYKKMRVSKTETPDRILDSKERIDEINEFILTLDEERQGIIRDRMGGMEYGEIAKKYSLPKGTVMSRLFYIREKLEKFLSERGIGHRA